MQRLWINSVVLRACAQRIQLVSMGRAYKMPRAAAWLQMMHVALLICTGRSFVACLCKTGSHGLSCGLQAAVQMQSRGDVIGMSERSLNHDGSYMLKYSAALCCACGLLAVLLRA